MANEFWPSDARWMAIERHRPGNRPGGRRVDGRRAIGRIIHVLQPAADGEIVHQPTVLRLTRIGYSNLAY